MAKRPIPLLLRSAEDRAEAGELRAVIAASLLQVPKNEFTLRTAVGSFVQAECRSGVPPATVITRLAALVEDAEISPTAARLQLLRRVILWGVEFYFGQVDDDGLGARSRGQLPTPTATS